MAHPNPAIEALLVLWDAATAEAENTDDWDAVVELEEQMLALGYDVNEEGGSGR